MTIAFALVCSLAPAFNSWVSGRTLLRRLDDPAFAERLEARRQSTMRVMVVSWAVVILLGGWHAGWLIPLSFVGIGVGGFPLRRAVFEETGSLAAFLGHTTRFITVMAGPWLGVLATAFIPTTNPWVFGITSAAWLSAMAWLALSSARVARWIFATSPISDPALTARFDDVLSRATCARPEIVRAGTEGGTWVNAFAIGGRAPIVLFTDGLLEVLEPDEAAAIFAHEVAHLEEFGAWRWQLRLMVPIALAACYAGVLLLVTRSMPASPLFAVGWPLALIVGGFTIGRGSRDRETASDLRGLELCGDGAALIGALTKLHLRARLPRRQAGSIERRGSHPSLARRLQAIRKAAGLVTEGQALEPIVAFDAKNALRAVAIFRDQIVFLEGIESASATTADAAVLNAETSTSVAYGDLTALRLAPTRTGLHLEAKRAGGKLPRIRVQDGDAELLQKALDSIDALLGSP
ncbi:MAG: Zn-dependent protease with chaperone function [Myxococcota bacterium]|jgi:Zn-dependent protease with chaperone function